jgi:hypothetical protein
MAFDSKYFTGTDSDSYFTEQSKSYLSATGLTVGEEPGIGFGPLAATQKAIMHGFQTVMMVMHPPEGSPFGREDRARQIDLISKQQLEATGEMININKMNFAVHGPIIDVLGYKGESGKEGIFSGEQREENLKTFKRVIENADKIAVKAWGENDAKKHNIPITIHPTNALGSQNDWFDSGYKDNDGKPIYGKTGSMVNRATGQIKPMQSTFKWLPIREYKDSELYSMKENTENNGFALFEVKPETHLVIANNTSMDDLKKTITDAYIKKHQIETSLGLDPNNITPAQKDELVKKYPYYDSLLIEINSAESELAHITSPKLGQAMGKNLYSSATDFSNEIFSEQLSRMAMASYKTKAQPVLCIRKYAIKSIRQAERCNRYC